MVLLLQLEMKHKLYNVNVFALTFVHKYLLFPLPLIYTSCDRLLSSTPIKCASAVFASRDLNIVYVIFVFLT